MWRKDITMCDLFGNKKKLDACEADRARLKELLDQSIPKPAPVFRQHIKSAYWVRTQLSALREQGCQLDIEPLVDEEYRVLSEVDFKVAIKYIGLDQRKYESIWLDCDDFMMLAPALLYMNFNKLNSCGNILDLSSLHAYNIGVVLEGAGIYEPQNASFNRDVGGRNINLYGMRKTDPNGYIQL